MLSEPVWKMCLSSLVEACLTHSLEVRTASLVWVFLPIMRVAYIKYTAQIYRLLFQMVTQQPEKVNFKIKK